MSTVQSAYAHRISYPDHRTIFNHLSDEFRLSITGTDTSEQASLSLSRDIESLKFRILSDDRISAINIHEPVSDLSEVRGFDHLTPLLRDRLLNQNEFFAVYDPARKEYIYVDSRAYEVLGIPREGITIRALFGRDKSNPLYHPADVHHAYRFSVISCHLLAIPGLRWNAYQDHSFLRMRIGTTHSHNPILRKQGSVVIEKKGCFAAATTSADTEAPFVLDKFSIYSTMEIDRVTKVFVSDNTQTFYMNALLYLYNAILINISPKYLLMLDERLRNDRYKIIANQLNKKIYEHTGIMSDLNEHHVGDCFLKTIRGKVQKAYNTWDKREGADRVSIVSDQEAINYACQLGILPIPTKIRELIYRYIK